MAQPDPEKIERLRQALADYAAGEAGEPLVDREEEKAKSKVRERALRLLDQRDRSRHELHQRLVDAEFPEATVVAVLDDLVNAGLIDDARFATEWVRQRHARRGKSARVLDMELQRKGVADVDRQEALEQIDESDEEVIARQLAAKKARSVKSVPERGPERDKALRRIVGVLARRGFPEGMALRIAIEALDSRCAELAGDAAE